MLPSKGLRIAPGRLLGAVRSARPCHFGCRAHIEVERPRKRLPFRSARLRDHPIAAALREIAAASDVIQIRPGMLLCIGDPVVYMAPGTALESKLLETLGLVHRLPPWRAAFSCSEQMKLAA